MGAGLLAAATLPDAITFAIAAVITVIGALGVVLGRNPVHAALMLVMTLFGVAVLFVEENAQFLAAVQVIVYTGAIVVLFLFVIMLIGVDRQEQVFADGFLAKRAVPFIVGLLVLAEVLVLAHQRWVTGAHSVSGSLNGGGSNVAVLGRSIFTTYLLPFEVTSALLVVAVIGAVVLARRPARAARHEREQAAGSPEAAGAPVPGPDPSELSDDFEAEGGLSSGRGGVSAPTGGSSGDSQGEGGVVRR
ncbi:MAG: NADH-ubiquinone/plastoquinone oxidoreductase chain 6 [Acidimicrobiaceae bacterium]|nr:NADH-ubiquinone/plastoquinone oxidoreductase chain 6 [Acidimicrobiaceae bacterium]